MREFNKRLWDNTACLTSPRLFNCIVNLEGGEKIVQSQADGVAERWNDWLRDFSRSTLLEGASPPLIAGSLITGRVSSQARSRWGWSHSSSPSHPPHWLCGSFLFSSLSVFYEPLQGPFAVPWLGTVTGAACRVRFRLPPPTREASNQLEAVSKHTPGQPSISSRGTITQPLRGSALRHRTVNLCLITHWSVVTSPAGRGEALGRDGDDRIYWAGKQKK